MPYSLGTKQLELLQIAFDDADSSTDIYGRFARAYELLFTMISKVSGGAEAILSESYLSTFSTQDLNDYYDNWKLNGLDSVDVSNWEKVDSQIEGGAWVFLRGVSHVNWGPDNPLGYETDYSKFIREYTKIQYELRNGTPATERGLIYQF